MKTEKETKTEQRKVKDYNFTKLKDHDIEKKVIKSAFSKLWTWEGTFKTVSWIDEKIPEMLWVILLRNKMEQDEFIYMFRNILDYWGKNGVIDIRHSWLKNYDQEQIKKFITELCSTNKFKVILRPLLLFWKELPLFNIWQNAINLEIEEEDEITLIEAIDKSFFHQSQEATDCRWVRLFLEIKYGKVSFNEQTSHIAQKILDYPFSWDMREVRPFIRSMELGLYNPIQWDTIDNTWNITFWEMCLDNVKCLIPIKKHVNIDKRLLLNDLKEVQKNISELFMENTTPGIDYELDTTIGISMYTLNILEDLCKSDNDCNSLSRIALRTIVENYINLSYLVSKNDEDLWKEFRNYWNWESKKAFLKLSETSNLPSFVKLSTLHWIANEDIWQEYVDIKLWDWWKSNLRNRAEEGWTKEIYDNFYDLTSWYTHWNWWAIKEQVYDVCLNPLHKYHRIPKTSKKTDYTVILDTIYIVNLILNIVFKKYWKESIQFEKGRYLVD